MKGRFIVVDGLGGSGKSTVMSKIEGWAKEAGLPYERTREPGGTPEAEYLREICRSGIPNSDQTLTPLTQMFLFNAARAENVAHVIRPALEQGKLVICDRYVDTTYAFQGGAGGVSLAVLEGVHNLTHNLNADMTFILDGDPTVFLKRISAEEMATDKFDNLVLTKLQKARSVYLERALMRPEAYRVIDATQSPDQVFAQILPHLMEIKNQVRKRPVVA
jgi:dTMP kinase